MLTTLSSLPIKPIAHPLKATVRVPGSKSLTNRALMISALANGTTRLTNALFSDDSHYFVRALQALGFNVQLDESNQEMAVKGLGGKIPATKAELFIGNSGTTVRFLSAFLTLGNGEYVLDGEPRMRERPIGDLIDALNQLGVKISPLSSRSIPEEDRREWGEGEEAVNSICPPVEIFAKGLMGGKTRIAGDISSQFLSALLMVAPYAQSPIEIELTTELNSKPYVDMTIATMQDFGVEIERHEYSKFTIQPASYFPVSSYPIESDASAASYFFAAPAICGGTVRVENMSRRSIQGDIGFLDVLMKMGCNVTETDNSILVTGSIELQGIDIDMRDIPDTAQTLAAVAPFAASSTRIRGIASARLKETDRIHATCTELTRLGVRVEEHADGMTIHPVEKMRPAIIQTYNDHRMAMAFSLIGLRFDGVTIENPLCVSKTFPGFFDVLETLR
ncbi:MAG TPA: 3-phosphoshikimate 1-carboxyvinyltransferase [Anaerolineales bacterium]|nr:3-phosphoshikimate 1-carboxyvinyltransferase [Anaerolineales bacterium]